MAPMALVRRSSCSAYRSDLGRLSSSNSPGGHCNGLSCESYHEAPVLPVHVSIRKPPGAVHEGSKPSSQPLANLRILNEGRKEAKRFGLFLKLLSPFRL